ncbi:hypothetical protein ACHQM5_011181 [Ranunculus cassubicifolius]
MNLPTITYLTLISLLITTAASQSYKNHTVGDSAGWLFNSGTNTTSADYSKWASTQTFNLGDFLIFNTTTNQTVIQTYNETTYKTCNSDDAQDSDTSEYHGGNEIDQALTLAVPLTLVGANYFFSSTEDGVQCAHGMKFEINVKQGLGLPPNLNQPPPPAYKAPPPEDSSESTPATPTSNDQGEKFYNEGGLRSGANVCLGWMLIGGYFVAVLLSV